MMNNRPMLPRFLVPGADPSRGRATLPADEAHHATRVLRLGSGDEVVIFDGLGHEYRARIETAGRTGVTVALIEQLEAAAGSRVPFVLAQGVLKAEAMDDVVRDATMMGASDVQPLLTAHTAVKPAVALRDATLHRWRRVALASAKQCRRAALPGVHPPRPFSEWLAAAEYDLTLLFVEPGSADAQSLRALLGRAAPATAALLVGPEGGWAPAEIRMALERGAVPVTLGGLTLRADAVPVAAIAICRFVWES